MDSSSNKGLWGAVCSIVLTVGKTEAHRNQAKIFILQR